jgi:arsenate reductase
MSTVTIWHNPACGTSRNTLGLIRNTGIEPTVIEYLSNPPSREQLAAMIKAAGLTVRETLRQKGTPYAELGLDNEKLSDDELLDAMLRHPILINRPFVVTELGTRLCRPSELVLDILPQPQRGFFAKEDGEVVVNEKGERVVSGFVVRPAAIEDAAQIADIYNYYIANTVITFEEEPLTAGDMATRLADMQRQGLPWLVAELDGQRRSATATPTSGRRAAPIATRWRRPST